MPCPARPAASLTRRWRSWAVRRHTGRAGQSRPCVQLPNNMGGGGGGGGGEGRWGEERRRRRDGEGVWQGRAAKLGPSTCEQLGPSTCERCHAPVNVRARFLEEGSGSVRYLQLDQGDRQIERGEVGGQQWERQLPARCTPPAGRAMSSGRPPPPSNLTSGGRTLRSGGCTAGR